ncbi:MAG: carboxymuconolactone decarboxylase family protein [Acidobacteriota bacterium]|nr:carboxymuconolactone decarboxylase family protein [Acidobacteriota bacterium]
MSQRLRYSELAPKGVAALRQLEHYINTGSVLEPALLEFVRLRVSTLNGCDYCIQMHTGELLKHHEPQTRIDAIADWPASDAFTPRERAALAYADAVTNIQRTHVTDEEYAAVNEFFAGKDLVDLTLAVAAINTWNRLAIPFRSEWDPDGGRTPVQAPGTNSAVRDDGSKVSAD